MPPAARVTDMHVCPMVTGVVPHVGGPILPPGAPTVLIDFLPAATVTNMATCVGPPDMIAMGSTGVLINFLPAARLGDPTVHGGVIVLGSPTCIIGEMGSPSPGTAGLGGIVAGLAIALTPAIVQKAIASVLAVGAAAVDSVTKSIAEAGAQFLAGNSAVRNWLVSRSTRDTSQLPFDGQVVGSGCRPSPPSTVSSAAGIRPTKCNNPNAIIPRVYFANGINTKLYGDGASMCDTMQRIADQTCAEVVGIYGATEGMLPDLDQAVNEIAKNSNSPQANALTILMMQAVESDPPQDINLIAHSRGGLATQEAVANAKGELSISMSPDEVDQALSHIRVQAYGTAEHGWPSGPQYAKLNNQADPVPSAIEGAQSSFPGATSQDNDPTPTETINDPRFNPIDAHSVTDVYAKHMGQAAGPRNCDCS